MLKLYTLLIIILVLAVAVLSIPFIVHRPFNWRGYLATALFTVLFSLGLYQFSGGHRALEHWFFQGQEHYQLQEQFNDLGGVDGIIERIEKKLEANPSDAQGWFILGKLYMAKQDYGSATAALKNAHDLEPDDKEITKYYDIAMNKFKSK